MKTQRRLDAQVGLVVGLVLFVVGIPTGNYGIAALGAVVARVSFVSPGSASRGSPSSTRTPLKPVEVLLRLSDVASRSPSGGVHSADDTFDDMPLRRGLGIRTPRI